MPSVEKVGIVALAALEIVAMMTGNDGVYLLPIVAIIAGLAGYKFGDYHGYKRKCG